LSWHYQIRKREDKGEVYFDIIEKYSDPEGWTANSITPIGETPQELTNELEHMLRDALEYPVFIEPEVL
jgi:hypothetical protein